MIKILKLVENFILYAILFLIPLMVLPIFPSAYITPKLMILTWGLGIILILKSIRIIAKGNLSFSTSTFDLPVLLLGLAFVLSMFTHTKTLLDSVLFPGTATLILGSIVLYFAINQLGDAKKNAKFPIIISGVIVSFISLLTISGTLSKLAFLPDFVKSANFSPLEGTLPTMIFLVVLLLLTIPSAVKEKDMGQKVLFGISSALLVFGAIISVYFSIPTANKVSQYPNLVTSWVVAADSIKENPFFGAGPGNYLISFNRFRPLAFNQGDNWNLRYNSSGSFYLTLLTEAGFIGLAALILIVIRYAYLVKDRKFTPEKMALGAMLVLLLVLPASTGVIVLLFALLAMASKSRENGLDLVSESHSKAVSRIPIFLVTIPVFLFVPVFFFFSGKLLTGEYVYRRALAAIVTNDGRGAYELLQKAIILSPYIDRYRNTYAQVNLALANSIASQENLTDDQKNTVSQLIQQAIAQGKVAVTLSPLKAGNWEVLSSIYKNVIPLAKGADQFALQTMAQAIALDPINSNYRINLGGIYYQLKNYDAAIDTFKLAVATKPNLANARYNLAIAYREKGDIERAIIEMNNVLSLIDKDSKDYELAQKELENLESKRPAKTAADGESLNAPSQVEESQTQIELPQDANPPAPQITPTPSPSATPTPDTP
jgi:tetratricopeptide (TPR) repeat protein